MRVLSFGFLVLSLLLASMAHAAVITSTATGDWSAGGTWVGGVAPADTDGFKVAAGHTVTLDADTSGFATGLVSGEIEATGVLDVATGAGTYYLKMTGDITNNGEMKAGTSAAVPLPFAAKYTIDFTSTANSIECAGGGIINFFNTEPTTKFVKLTAQEPGAETVMAVDTNVTADIWTAGDVIEVSEGATYNDTESHTINAIAAGTITLNAGLAAQKEIDSFITLVTRNIRIIGSTTFAIQDVDGSVINCEISCTHGIDGSTTGGNTIGGAIKVSESIGVALKFIYGSTVNAAVTGSRNGFNFCFDTEFTTDGVMSGCYYPCANSRSLVLRGNWTSSIYFIWLSNSMVLAMEHAKGYNTAILSCFDITLQDMTFDTGLQVTAAVGNITASGCTFQNNARDLSSGTTNGRFFDCTFASGTEFNGYNDETSRGKWNYVESVNHDGVTNAYKAWCVGGITTSQTASPPTGFDIWYEHACEDADNPAFRQFETTVQPGTAIEVEGYIRIADAEDHSANPPALQIINSFADPLVDSTQSPLDEDEIAIADGSEAGWQAVSVIYANQFDYPVVVKVRMFAQHATGDVDEVWAIADYQDQINTILSVVRPVDTTVSASDTTTSFTLTLGENLNDTYNNVLIQVQDADDADDHWVERTINDWTAGRVVTLDTALPFTPAVGDKARIIGTGYGAAISDPVNANLTQINGATIPVDNFEDQYDTTGLAGDTFPATQAQLANLANVGTAVNQTPSSYTLTTGVQSSGTVSSTEELDGVNHEHTGATEMDLYYEFTIGAGIPETVVMTGYLNGNNDDLEVYGYDWVSVGWKQIGTLEGKAQSTNEVDAFDLFVNMVGNGADEGKVRVRFTDGAFTLSTATLAIDQIFISFSLGMEGYDNGAIWINTNVTNTNTVVGIDGTSRNPVSTMAAANTLAALTNLDHFEIAPGSSITFVASQENQTFNGEIWTLALGGVSISGSHIIGADVSGICTGASEPRFFHCHLGSMTIPPADLESCFLAGTITAGSAGNFFFEKCQSGVAGTGAPVFDFGSGLNASNLNFRAYSGGIDIRYMGQGTGSYNMSLEGFGQLIINANCSATSTIAIRGHFTITNNATGITLSDLAMFDHNTIIDDILTDTDTTIPTTITTAHTTTDGLITTVDTVVDGIKAVTDVLPNAGALTDIDTGINNIETTVITNAAGADIAADIIALKAETVLIVEDTGTTIPVQINSVHTTTDGKIDALNDLSAAQVNAEVDTALSDYDGPTRTEATADKDEVLAAIAALNNLTADQVWLAVVEGAYDFKDYMRLMMSAIGGKVSGGGTTTITYRDTADTKDRVTYTIDAMGNRTAVTLDPD